MNLSGLGAPPTSEQERRVLRLSYAGRKLSPADSAYPTLCWVRHDNTQPNATPVSDGYLYRKGNEFHYSSPGPDDPQFLFEFDPALSAAGKDADWYLPLIAPDGSVILIWHGNYIHEFGGSSQDARHNPIVYPAGDFANPVVVNITGSDKPTAPLNHLGADFDPASGALIFAEYTRPVHSSGHIWRVTAPYTSPEDWSIVHTEVVNQGDTSSGAIKHFHSVQYDPFSGTWFATSGDLGKQRKLFTSTDGITWTLTRDDHNALRMLNAIPTADYLWWGTDNVYPNEENWLYRVPRLPGGAPDWDALEAHRPLLPSQAVYSTHYVTEPEGLLFLSRLERWPDYGSAVAMQFYSFERDTVTILDALPPLPTLDIPAVGFRCEGVSVYANTDPTTPIIAGFGGYRNQMDVLDNGAANPINTLDMLVTEVSVQGTDTPLPLILTGIPQRRRQARAPEGPFTPASLSGLALWLDASDPKSALAENGDVAHWLDKSTQDNHAHQPVAAQRPALVAGALNGLPVVRFDRVDDYLDLPHQSSLSLVRSVPGFTVFAIANAPANATQTILSLSNTAGNAPRFALLKSVSFGGASVGTRRLNEDFFTQIGGAPLGEGHQLLVGCADYVNGSLTLRQDGAVTAEEALETKGVSTDDLSAAARIGGSATGGSLLGGDIAEVVAYQRALTASEQRLVEEYLAAKWGLALADEPGE